MRKIISLAGIVLMFGGLNTWSQAYINANNSGLSVFITIQDPAINGDLPTKIGTPAVVAGYAAAGPGQVTISLYAALAGTPLSVLESPLSLITTTNNTTSLISAAQGIEALGNPFKLPTKPGFDGSQPLEFVFFGQDALGNFQGFSTVAASIIPATVPNIPTLIFGTAPELVNSFNLTGLSSLQPIPEPSTMAIAGVGAAMTLFTRRRK